MPLAVSLATAHGGVRLRRVLGYALARPPLSGVCAARAILARAPACGALSECALRCPSRACASTTAAVQNMNTDRTATTTSSSTPPSHCVLCDVACDEEPWLLPPTATNALRSQQRWWRAHRHTPTHVARDAICRQFISPDRSAFILQHLEKHLRLDLSTLDEVDAKRARQRRRRLFSSLEQLRVKKAVWQYTPQRGASEGSEDTLLSDGTATLALSDSLTERVPEHAAGLVVTDAFLNHMLLGESHARVEVMDRVARLMPRTSAAELSSIAAYILSTRQLSQLFDALQLASLLTHALNSDTDTLKDGDPSDVSLTTREKAVVVYSCVGELLLFTRRDRPRGVVDKPAADSLVLHVLASHALDGILVELVHGTLQRVVDEGMPVFSEYEKSR